MNRAILDPGITRWGRLTYLGDAPPYISPAGARGRVLRCRCDCGKETEVRLCSLRRGASQSCGCGLSQATSLRFWKHGYTKGVRGRTADSYLYRLWCHIRDRCENPSNRKYPAYGGRGITVSREWHDFPAFLSDILGSIGERPSHSHSLDRINNDGHYEPGNVRWATRGVQASNTRRYLKVPVGRVCGDLTILAEGPRSGKNHRRMVRCRCSCGTEASFDLSRVLRGEAHRCIVCGYRAAGEAISKTIQAKRTVA